ncbi:MAG TPA: hydroxyisourate hydrolase [Vicinamibacterales bacterium]|nr:hydroxyisourate hydrolase [Vicinamibacterales bacterium]
MSAITTHVLDTSTGRPAAAVTVVLEAHHGPDEWSELGRGETDPDGRLRTLLTAGAPLAAGMYRLTFDTRSYFERSGVRAFYPSVSVVFEVVAGEAHYHVPILVSPFGYTTYRGS